MDYRKTAQEIYDHIGKKENIISAAHCATRLRLVISDNSKADTKSNRTHIQIFFINHFICFNDFIYIYHS